MASTSATIVNATAQNSERLIPRAKCRPDAPAWNTAASIAVPIAVPIRCPVWIAPAATPAIRVGTLARVIVVFGEITATPASGLEPFWPGGTDLWIGDLWKMKH